MSPAAALELAPPLSLSSYCSFGGEFREPWTGDAAAAPGARVGAVGTSTSTAFAAAVPTPVLTGGGLDLRSRGGSICGSGGVHYGRTVRGGGLDLSAAASALLNLSDPVVGIEPFALIGRSAAAAAVTAKMAATAGTAVAARTSPAAHTVAVSDMGGAAAGDVGGGGGGLIVMEYCETAAAAVAAADAAVTSQLLDVQAAAFSSGAIVSTATAAVSAAVTATTLEVAPAPAPVPVQATYRTGLPAAESHWTSGTTLGSHSQSAAGLYPKP